MLIGSIIPIFSIRAAKASTILFIFYVFIFFNWSIKDLQHFVSFRWMANWFTHTHTYMHTLLFFRYFSVMVYFCCCLVAIPSPILLQLYGLQHADSSVLYYLPILPKSSYLLSQWWCVYYILFFLWILNDTIMWLYWARCLPPANYW